VLMGVLTLLGLFVELLGVQSVLGWFGGVGGYSD
jgi:hypothetical protein